MQQQQRPQQMPSNTQYDYSMHPPSNDYPNDMHSQQQQQQQPLSDQHSNIDSLVPYQLGSINYGEDIDDEEPDEDYEPETLDVDKRR
nr:hypothetical protein [Schistosoma japonicum]